MVSNKFISWLGNQRGFITYLVKRTIVLSIVLVAVVLSIVLIAGGFGIMDRIQRLQIQREVIDLIRGNPSSGRWTSEERQAFITEMTTLLEKARGLDQPYYTRVFGYLFQVLTWDFGRAQTLTAFTGSMYVRDMILERMPRTIILFTTATLLSAIFGTILALIVARKPFTLLDRFTSAFAVITNSIPWWWFGMLMIILFAYTLKILPSGGFLSVPAPSGTIPIISDILYHMILPTLTIVLISFAGWAYVIRSILLDIYQQDYILFARAKGLKESVVMYRHALRAAMPPVVTMLLFNIVSSLGGAIITETVFEWQGMGLLFYAAILQQDLPVIVALTFVSSFLTILVVLILDILYALLDPRVRTAPVIE
ncbi:MAG: ABC transporter permease [Candidatus Helarchaeota archaeon]|nr:ABC transporter permease [Candidatus Helarchaeota archaeon]